MRAGSGVVLVLLAASMLAAIPVPPAAGDTSPPTIEDRWWSPRVPIVPESEIVRDTKIFARVTDPDGVQLVDAIWCYLPPFLCQYPTLFDDGTNGDEVAGDDVYTAIVETHPGVEGASFKVHAVDMQNNQVLAPPVYAFFATTIAVTLESEALSAEPGAVVSVRGTAFYGNTATPPDGYPPYNANNASAPAEGVVVTVSAGEASAQGTVDATGSFTAALTAPRQEGTFPMTVTAQDRTISGSAEGTLAVSLTPRPDLVVGNVELPASIVAGQPATIRFDVRNVGSANAVGVQVLVEALQVETWVTILDERVTVAKGGGKVTLAATWTPVEGTRSVRITIDPAGEVEELDETNGISLVPLAVTPGGPPALLVAAGAGIGIAVAALAGALVVRRRRSRST